MNDNVPNKNVAAVVVPSGSKPGLTTEEVNTIPTVKEQATPPNPSIRPQPSDRKTITIEMAKAHLDNVKNFVLGAKYNGKTGYNPYQWLADRNVAELELSLEGGQPRPSQETLAAIMALPLDEEPVIRTVKTKRIDEFFSDNQKARQAKLDGSPNKV